MKLPEVKQYEWVGCDLDGTLAQYERGDYSKYGKYHIGQPIPKMVDRIIAHLQHGDKVKILTARAADEDPKMLFVIQEWCEKHLGQPLPVTYKKTPDMAFLYDDRAYRVESNTGNIAELDG